MFELVISGGWLMIPIIACSVISVSIIIERFWSLQREKVIPRHLVTTIWQWVKDGQLERQRIEEVSSKSSLGKILAVGLMNRALKRERIKEAIEENGRHVVHQLERFLNTLGTISAISPLLGLLGTVIGMIKVFTAITTHGVGNPADLAGGISQALITTASGLSVAIISLIFYRYFRGRIDAYVVEMEQEAIKMVDVLHKNRSSSRNQA